MSAGQDPLSEVIRFYQPWPAPVQAACFSGSTVLPEIEGWVTALRERGAIATDVELIIRRRGGTLIGVLRDRSGERELPPGGFLVYGRGGLQVLDERSFFRQYHDPERR